MAASDVRYAALVDHDTLDGQQEFRSALQKRQIGFLAGVELSVQEGALPIHILGYGFNPSDSALKSALHILKQQQGKPDTTSAAEIIAVLHNAGGKAFLAHPLSYGLDEKELDALCLRLRNVGLDGLEVHYASYSPVQLARLEVLAQKHRLLASAGSDFHNPHVSPLDEAFVEFPWADWVDFRNALGLTATHQRRKPEKMGYVAWAASRLESRIRQQAEKPNFRRFAVRIFIPAIMTIALLVSAFWMFVIPSFESQLLDRKREMIRELTNSAWSVLAKYNNDERKGIFTTNEAQRRALSDIRAIRYGDEQKDYFWVTDLKPNMLMHPYRADLNGTDVSNFKDAGGKRVFVEFVETVKKRDSGYVEYRWQWKDNADKIVPKESYVKVFKPWGWVIGTGIYIEDVAQEISRIERKIMLTSLATLALIALLMVYILRQSLGIEKQRVDAVNALKDSRDRYRALVEASNEGNFMVIDGKCVFSSRKFLEMIDYNEREIDGLGLADIMYSEEDSNRLSEALLKHNHVDSDGRVRLEVRLKTRTGNALDVVLAATPISIATKPGFIFSARDAKAPVLSVDAFNPSRERLVPTLDFVRFGILRVGASKSLPVFDANFTARKLLGIPMHQDPASFDLLRIFPDLAAAQAFVASFNQVGSAKAKLRRGSASGQRTILEIEARQVKTDSDEILFGLITLEDITERDVKEQEREKLLEQLRHLYVPFVSSFEKFAKPLPVVSMSMSCGQALTLASRSESGVLLVSDEDNTRIVGYVDRKILLCAAIESPTTNSRKQIYEIMKAPVSRLPEGASASEALNILGKDADTVVLLDSPRERRWYGLVRDDFFNQQTRPIATFQDDYSRAERFDALPDIHERHQSLLLYGFESGSDPAIITRLISWETDLVVEKVFALAFRELGTPPVPFAFMALGSHGRMEQTFRTDQDNAIVFTDVPKDERKDVDAYFFKLGEMVCSWMDQIGYPFCRGNVMARNPRWVMPLADWVKTFSAWIRLAEPQALLEFNMFFDFRSVHGDASLVSDLRSRIGQVMNETPTFFMHLAENAMRYKPPISFFGNLIVGEDAESPSTLSIKDAMLPITNFTRIYALKGEVEETNTLRRLDALRSAGVLSKSTFEDIRETFCKLMALRLRHQVVMLLEGNVPNNSVDPRSLTSFDRALLKHAMGEISTMLKKISYDFLGGSV